MCGGGGHATQFFRLEPTFDIWAHISISHWENVLFSRSRSPDFFRISNQIWMYTNVVHFFRQNKNKWNSLLHFYALTDNCYRDSRLNWSSGPKIKMKEEEKKKWNRADNFTRAIKWKPRKIERKRLVAMATSKTPQEPHKKIKAIGRHAKRNRKTKYQRKMLTRKHENKLDRIQSEIYSLKIPQERGRRSEKSRLQSW